MRWFDTFNSVSTRTWCGVFDSKTARAPPIAARIDDIGVTNRDASNLQEATPFYFCAFNLHSSHNQLRNFACCAEIHQWIDHCFVWEGSLRYILMREDLFDGKIFVFRIGNVSKFFKFEALNFPFAFVCKQILERSTESFNFFLFRMDEELKFEYICSN